MTEVSKPRKQTVRVVYAFYDYATRVEELRYGDAVIEPDGTAVIQLNMFGVKTQWTLMEPLLSLSILFCLGRI